MHRFHRIAREFRVVDPCQYLLQHRAHFHLGQVHAEAVVIADAEGADVAAEMLASLTSQCVATVCSQQDDQEQDDPGHNHSIENTEGMVFLQQ